MTAFDATGGDPEVRIVSAAGEGELALLGPGEVGDEPWGPSGEFLIVKAPGSDASADRGQLWCVSTLAPYPRVQLTHLQRGVRGGGDVSQDGAWASALVDTTDYPGLAIVDLTALRGPDHPSVEAWLAEMGSAGGGRPDA